MGDEIEDAEARGGKLGREKGTVGYIHDIQKHAIAHTAEDDEDRDPGNVHEEEKIEGGTNSCC